MGGQGSAGRILGLGLDIDPRRVNDSPMAFEQFTIRMDPALHKKLCQAAAKDGTSLSAFVVGLLDEWAKAKRP